MGTDNILADSTSCLMSILLFDSLDVEREEKELDMIFLRSFPHEHRHPVQDGKELKSFLKKNHPHTQRRNSSSSRTK